jgi:hypothetical protein
LPTGFEAGRLTEAGRDLSRMTAPLNAVNDPLLGCMLSGSRCLG